MQGDENLRGLSVKEGTGQWAGKSHERENSGFQPAQGSSHLSLGCPEKTSQKKEYLRFILSGRNGYIISKMQSFPGGSNGKEISRLTVPCCRNQGQWSCTNVKND